MRISLVSLGQSSAGPVYSLEMAKALAAIPDCKLQVIISKGVDNLLVWKEAFVDSNVEFHMIDSYQRTIPSVLINNFNFVKQEKLVKLIKSFHADVLYIPFGLMWARYVFWRLYKTVKIISTIHDVQFHDSVFHLSIAELGSYLLNYGSEKYVDSYVILNQKDRHIVEKKYKKPVAVIPHASYNYYFRKEKVIDIDGIHKRIAFFGRIETYKGIDILVEAFESCDIDGIELIIAGGGTIPDILKSRIISNKRITLINRFIEDEEIPEILSKVDFVVLPYKRASQSGVIPLCFAAGKPVIATNVGALEEQVPDGAGIIVEPNSNAIITAIRNMYSNPDKIKTMGIYAKHYADTELSWKHSAELLINFCKSICKQI